MAEFVYKVRDQNGRIFHGVSEAVDIDAMKKVLRDGGWFTLDVGLYKKNKFGLFNQGVKLDSLIMFTHELTSMLESGIPILKAMDILWKQVDSPRFQIVISRMKNKLSEGASINEAFNEFPEVFPPLYRALLGVAEFGADISKILRKLLQYLINQKSFTEKLQKAIAYPMVVVSFAILVVLVMLMWVIPTFQTVFKKINVELPLFTQIVINISSAFRTVYFWLIAAALIGGSIYFYRRFVKTTEGRLAIDTFKLKMPIFGKIFYIAAISRLVRSLSLLIGAGLPLTESLAVARATALNVKLSNALETVQRKIVQGNPLGVSIGDTGVFPAFLSEMITVGEASGTLPEMLERMAVHFEEEFDSQVNRFLTLLEPLLIIFVGGLVLLIIMSIYLPIFKLWGGFNSRG